MTTIHQIHHFVQGVDGAADRNLFGLIGHWLVDKAIQDLLGTAISAAAGDLWWLVTDADEQAFARAFATARSAKSGAMHVRFIHSASDQSNLHAQLIVAATAYAQAHRIKRIWTFDRPGVTHWKEAGFSSTAIKRRTFVRWELKTGERE